MKPESTPLTSKYLMTPCDTHKCKGEMDIQGIKSKKGRKTTLTKTETHLQTAATREKPAFRN